MRIDPLRTAPLLLAIAAAACGGSPAGGDSGGATARSMDVGGVEVVLDTSAPFARAPDFPARVETTIDAALRYWGGSWGQLDGRSVTLVDAPSVSCGGRQSLGCTDPDIRLTTRDPGAGTVVCIEDSVLVHEIGHAIIGDPDHEDPRWMEMNELAAELAGRVGYDEGGETPCVPHVSVWRHPLGSP